MPFVSNMPDEDQKSQSPSQGPVAAGGTGQSVRLAPSGGVGQAGAGAGAPAKSTGGQFATLQNYVDANQGQAAPLTGKITSGINDQYNTLAGQNQNVLSGVQGQVNSGYTPQDTGLLQQEAENPVSFASNPSNVSSFQKQLNDQYNGPMSAESTGSYQDQVAANSQAAANAKNANSEAGLQQSLQQIEKAPNTSVTGLNEAIISQDPNALTSINSAYQPFAGLNDQLSAGAQGINQSIAQNQQQAQSASAAANKAIADQSSDLTNTLNQNLTNAGTQAKQYQQNVQNYNTTQEKSIQDAINAFEKGVATDSLGRPVIPTSDFNNIGMGAFAPGATPTSALPTLAQVATPDQYALGSALSQLGGTNPLQGMTASTYNPLATNPTIQQITAPTVSPLEQFMSQYFAASNPNGAAQGSQFGAGSPTEANVLPFEQAFVQPQYQTLMNALNTAYGINAPTYGPQPTRLLPGGGGPVLYKKA